MATNHYFNNYNAKFNEQHLVEDLIVESIKMMGADCFYLPNDNSQQRDIIYGEDPLKTFNSSYAVEIYPSSVMNYGGDKELFSKFGLEIRNKMTVVISKRTFSQRVSNSAQFSRPREGDLIYIPQLNGVGELFEIVFVDQDQDMSMMGRRPAFFYELELEKFKYSHEEISTGNPDIDIVQQEDAYSQRYTFSNLTNSYLIGETIFQSNDLSVANSTASGTISNFDIINNTVDINSVVGEFTLNTLARGNLSNATSILTSTDEYDESEYYANYDNKEIKTESDEITNFSENNPFGIL